MESAWGGRHGSDVYSVRVGACLQQRSLARPSSAAGPSHTRVPALRCRLTTRPPTLAPVQRAKALSRPASPSHTQPRRHARAAPPRPHTLVPMQRMNALKSSVPVQGSRPAL